jgi:hypothetical protein
MTLRSKTLCWKFLNPTCQDAIPVAFVAFYFAIKDAGSRNGFIVSADEQLITEERIQAQMADIVRKSQLPRAAVLPGFGHTLNVQGESWQILLKATEIPHLRAAVVERKPTSHEEIQYRFRIVRELIERGDVDFGKTADQRFHGKTWELYIFLKTRKLKPLDDAFNRRPFLNGPVLLSPDQVFPQLRPALPAISTIDDEKSSVRKFLDQCDQALMGQVGEAGLVDYLRNTSISPKQFLRAQKPSFFG